MFLLACVETGERVWPAAVTGCCIVLHDSCVHKRPWPPDPSLQSPRQPTQFSNQKCALLPRAQRSKFQTAVVSGRYSITGFAWCLQQIYGTMKAHNLSASEVMWRGGLSAVACLLTHTQIRLVGLVVHCALKAFKSIACISMSSFLWNDFFLHF